jgi:hypothetical protein
MFPRAATELLLYNRRPYCFSLRFSMMNWGSTVVPVHRCTSPIFLKNLKDDFRLSFSKEVIPPRAEMSRLIELRVLAYTPSLEFVRKQIFPFCISFQKISN